MSDRKEYPFATASEKDSKRDRVNPCAVCGWARHMAIHQLRDDGSPFGHSYRALASQQASQPAEQEPNQGD